MAKKRVSKKPNKNILKTNFEKKDLDVIQENIRIMEFKHKEKRNLFCVCTLKETNKDGSKGWSPRYCSPSKNDAQREMERIAIGAIFEVKNGKK